MPSPIAPPSKTSFSDYNTTYQPSIPQSNSNLLYSGIQMDLPAPCPVHDDQTDTSSTKKTFQAFTQIDLKIDLKMTQNKMTVQTKNNYRDAFSTSHHCAKFYKVALRPVRQFRRMSRRTLRPRLHDAGTKWIRHEIIPFPKFVIPSTRCRHEINPVRMSMRQPRKVLSTS